MITFELFKKELSEFIRTPKGLILGILFLFFAISSPVLAKYMNEILVAVATDIEITFPDPTLKDSWLQIYKNLNTLCIIVFLIVMTGTVSQEKAKGSILLVLTKNVSRLELLLAKFLAGSFVFTILMLLTALVGGWYTNILFGAFMYEGLIQSIVMLWLMGIFFTALAVFVSVLGKTPTTSALLGFFFFAVLQIVNISQGLALFNPAGASSVVNGVVAESVDLRDLWKPMVSAIVGCVLMLVLSQLIFRKQEL